MTCAFQLATLPTFAFVTSSAGRTMIFGNGRFCFVIKLYAAIAVFYIVESSLFGGRDTSQQL